MKIGGNMKLRYVLLLMICFLTLDVKAIDSCSSSELSRLNELAKNVEIKYDYSIEEETSDDIDENDIN